MNFPSRDQSQVLQKLIERSKWQYFSKLYEKNNLNTQTLQLLILIHIIFDPLFEYFQIDAIGYIKKFNSFESLIFLIKNQQVKEIDSDRMLVARSYVLKIFTNKKERFIQIDEDLEKLSNRLYLISINVMKVRNNSSGVKKTKNDQNYYLFEKRYDEAIQQFYYVPVYSAQEEPNGLQQQDTKCIDDIISKIDKAAEIIRQGKQELRDTKDELHQSSQSEEENNEEQVPQQPLISVFTVETIYPSQNDQTQKNRSDLRRQTMVDRADDEDKDDLEIRRVSVGNIVKNLHNIVDLSMVSQKSSKSIGKFITRFSAKRFVSRIKKQVDSNYTNIKQQKNQKTQGDNLMESEDSSPILKNQYSLVISPRDVNQTISSQAISLPMERSSQSFTSFLRKSVVNDRKSILYGTPKNILPSDQQQPRMSILQKHQNTPISITPKLEIKEVQSDDVSCVESKAVGNMQVTITSQNITSSDESDCDSEESIAISQQKQDKELELNDQYMISVTNMDKRVVQQETFNKDEYGEALAMLRQFHQLQDQGLQIKQTQRSTRLSIVIDSQDKKQPPFQFNIGKKNTQNTNPNGLSPTPSAKIPPAALTNIYIAPKIQAIQSELFDMIRDNQVAEPVNKIHPKKLMLNSLTWIKQGSKVYK